MDSKTYKELGIGACISFFVALFGVISSYKAFIRYGTDKYIGETQSISYYLNNILQVFFIVSIILVLYFCLKIIIKAFKDLQNKRGEGALISAFGFLSSSVLIVMALVSEYSLGLLYDFLNGSLEVFIATLIDIPSLIGILTCIYFYFILLFHLKKSQGSDLKNYKKLGIGAGASFIVSFFAVISRKVFSQQVSNDERLIIYVSYCFGRILIAFSLIGMIMGLYFLFKIIVKVLIDYKKNKLEKRMLFLYGFLASISILILTSVYVLIDVTLPFYIAMFTCIYFYISYFLQVLKKNKK